MRRVEADDIMAGLEREFHSFSPEKQKRVLEKEADLQQSYEDHLEEIMSNPRMVPYLVAKYGLKVKKNE